jgi:Mrp family chromosome partitioning ATPase
MRTVLEEIINQYDDRLIIFDLPPLLLDDDALVFTPYVDASLLIVESGGRTRARDVEHCLQLLQGTNVIGTVFNKLAEYELG